MEKAFESVKKLVEDFGAHERDYLSPNYQESHVRQDFIDKFFTALGWDVTHERQIDQAVYELGVYPARSGRLDGGGDKGGGWEMKKKES